MSFNQTAPAQVAPQSYDEKNNSMRQTAPMAPHPHPQAQPVPAYHQSPMPVPSPMPVVMPVPQGHVASCSDPTLACCSRCGFNGVTMTKKNATSCQTTSSILLVIFVPIVGILMCMNGYDIDHHCSRCGFVIGTKKGWC